MSLTISIEPMTLEDLEAVARIEKEAFEQPWSVQSFRTELIRNKMAHYLVARVGDKVAGYGGIWVIFNEAHLTTLAGGSFKHFPVHKKRHDIAFRLFS